jgi:hypothetical protein
MRFLGLLPAVGSWDGDFVILVRMMRREFGANTYLGLLRFGICRLQLLDILMMLFALSLFFCMCTRAVSSLLWVCSNFLTTSLQAWNILPS